MTIFTETNTITKIPAAVYRRKRGWGAALLRQILGLGPTSDDVGGVEIEYMLQELLKLPGVEGVRAVAFKHGDLHEITFEILSHTEGSEWVQLTQKATALIIEAEWKLSDMTQDEDWLFGAQMVRSFGSNLREDRIVTFSYARSQHLSAAS